jgi:predicted Zn-dependent protease
LTGTEEESLAAEQELGAHMAQAYLEEVPLLEDPEMQEQVRSVGGQLAGWVANRRRAFRFGCVALEEPAAVAIPGGFIFVSAGLLELCTGNEDQLAGLLGHEIGHVVKNHAFERAVASKFVQLISQGAMVGGPLKRAALGLLTNFLDKGYSEDQEFEADVFGVRLAHAAGFHAGGLMQCLKSTEGLPATGSFLQSHPPVLDRIEHLRSAF